MTVQRTGEHVHVYEAAQGIADYYLIAWIEAAAGLDCPPACPHPPFWPRWGTCARCQPSAKSAAALQAGFPAPSCCRSSTSNED
jgi:hypothetical protein